MTVHASPRDARLAARCAHRSLATAAAVAAGLGALAAACAPAPGRPGATPGSPASPVRVQGLLAAAGATGPAVVVWTWTRGFVDGDPGAAPLAHALTWVAPAGPSAAPSGTVTARQGPAGDVAVAARDDDADLARALRTLAPDDTLVSDRSGWLVVTGDRVRPLLPARAAGAASPRGASWGTSWSTVTVDGYRDVLAARAAAEAAGPPAGTTPEVAAVGTPADVPAGRPAPLG